MTTFAWTHQLYRLFNADGDLLYIGRTNNLNSRFGGHAATQPWWGEVARSTIELLPTFEALDEAERATIKAERPRYNVIHNRDIPEPAPQMIERKPQRPRRKMEDIPDGKPVVVRPVDMICASHGRLPQPAGGVHLCIHSDVFDTYDHLDAPLDVEQLAFNINLGERRVKAAVDHLFRGGWLMEIRPGWVRKTIPDHVFALGSDVCHVGCQTHGGSRGEVGPVAPIAMTEQDIANLEANATVWA